ncbi:hypothetical protein EV360DRAFT_55898 [Lentinula raphanica]|nr:hypothetical protein EV360DRAFT_55898 [Lentinula raphanica]
MAGQSATPIEPFFNDLHAFYTADSTTPLDTKINRVWYKIIVDGVSTGSQWRLSNGVVPRPHNPEELQEELKLYNPALTGVTLALEPRFVVPPSELAHKRESSIQFAVADGQLAEEILRGRVINMFGKACRVRKFQDRTPSTPQCRRCKAFGHRGDQCKAQERCALCGGGHTEVEHTLQCGTCKANPRYIETEFDEDSIMSGIVAKCTHNLRCVNCAEKNLEALHSATSRDCPERIRQMGTTRDINRQGQNSKSSDEFQQVTKKKARNKKKVPEPTTNAQSTSGSRYASLDQMTDNASHNDDDCIMSTVHV